MYIEEVIIDGFKSYATRTTVTGFDPYFNAITGLNGSGKSNILDAICFVLGISNLSQVRVGNLQELVYKHGQAGVTKASVTIIFNNSDKKGSPVGFEHFDQISVTRQVVLGGKNKYVLNGHTVQASQVQNLFHSVQLNVNNPHFLIMQGRITKVLNMKPPEILGMIEEAAGTRMFENKKQAALKTIEKKEAKMQEINKVLATEINPTLDRLRGEKKHYMKWSANNTEIEKLERVCVAYQYHVAHQEVSQSDGELKEMEEEKDRMKAEMVELHKGVEERVKEVKQLKQLRDKDYEKAYEKAKAKEEALSKELVKATTVWKNKKASADSEAKAIDAMGQQAGDAKGAVDAKAHEIQDCEGALEVARTVVAEKEGALNAAKQAYQEMCAGVSSSQAEDSMDTGDESSSATLTDLLSTTAQAAQAAKSESAQLQLKISHLEKAIAEAKKDLHKSDSEARKMDGERQALAKAVQDLRNKIKKLGFDEASSSSLQSKIAEEEAALDGLRPLLDRLTAQLQGRLSFDYKDPEARFDRSRVKGLVARLVHLKDPAAATALEVVAGSKLYQVVVDNEQTGKLLLQKGGLRRRVTIIPLNKISHNVLDASRLRKANDVAKAKRGQVNLALELVGFDEEVRAAIEHVFGTALVADSLDLAKALAFNKEIGRRTVTLDGDCFDPSGTLTGGSKQQIGAVLGKLQELGQVTAEVEERTARLHDYKTQLAKQAGAAKEYEKLSSSLEVKEHELKLLEERAGQSLHAMQAGQIEEQERELVEARAAQVQAKARGEEAGKKLKQLKAQEEKLRKQREDKLKALEAALGKAKRAHKEAVEHMKGLEQRLKVLRLEMKSLTGDNSSLEEQLSSSRAALDKAQEEVKVLEEQLQAKKAEYEDASNTLAEAKKQLTVCDKQIAKIQAENDKANKAAAAAELESKKLENKLSRYLKDKAAARRTLQHMLEKYPWIETERQFFGRRLTDYDFEAMDLAKSQDRLKRLQDEQQKLAKKINKKVVGMIEKVEGECSELVSKLETIENDKKKIESVIEELDVKKNEALETTWVKVTGDFGSIFSSLLPGTSAKLEPPEGGSVLDGLEVKVAFGTVWKESLTELSGGQRSLLALSLILALLLFKPAPMYILDEVDAALDLSHTQNIGAMLRTYFSHSQFIVVSLKEGMFNNANVIFRTRFVDGVSTVTRTLGNGPSLNKQAAAQRNARAEERKEGDAAAGKSRKKNKVGPADGASSSSSSASRIAVGQEN